MRCERCGKEHDGGFGSGRFCNRSCANARVHSDITKAKIRKTLSDKFEKVYCSVCGKQVGYNNKTKLCVDCLNHTNFGKAIRSELTKSAAKGKNWGGYRKGSGRGKHGWYNGYYCDSSWELAYVIYNLDHNIKFERNEELFPYMFNGKQHKYKPDFIEGDTYIEIKGYSTEQWEAKREQFLKPLKVLYKKDIKFYLAYAEEKYGQNWITLYQPGSIPG